MELDLETGCKFLTKFHSGNISTHNKYEFNVRYEYKNYTWNYSTLKVDTYTHVEFFENLYLNWVYNIIIKFKLQH